MFSIIICTYNPEEKIFQRLLNSIKNFTTTSPEHEVIIVDNNSKPALCTNNIVKDFLKKNTRTKLLTEDKPGLTNARIKGITASKHDWIIFFDDDNEPGSDYLLASSRVINDYPKVGALGPGIIKVKYIDKRETPFLNNQKDLFQQRNMDHVVFDNNMVEGNSCFPYGTGLVIRSIILQEYANQVKQRHFTMIDRNAGSLTSGGDSQMLYVALKMGYYAGSAPAIQLTHNILPSKLKLRNILKLVYSTNAGQIKSYNEVFTDHPYQIRKIHSGMIFKSFIGFTKQLIKHPLQLKYELISLSKKLGMLKAQIIAGSQKENQLLNAWEKILNI